MPVRWNIATSTTRPGAIAIVDLRADTERELDDKLGAVVGTPVGVGRVALRSLCAVDEGLVARLSGTSAQLMPHAGAVVLRRLADAFGSAGLVRAEGLDPVEAYPEATDEIESRMLDALARAASPRAIDLLLDQPGRWREGRDWDEAHSRVLDRLIEPPLVVAIGPANIGKSTLVNALSGRAVAVVADEPGTTRDHVGVLIELDGLTARYVDTPGVRAEDDALEQDARRIADELLPQADLVLSIGDARTRPLERDGAVLVAARTDLGEAGWAADARVCAPRGEGLAELARLVRERLVPDGALEDGRAWRFWRDPEVGS